MSVFGRLFKPRPAQEAGRRLYSAASAKARQPALYAEGLAADTPEGRFEVYTLHVVLLLHRLKGEGAEAAEIAQALFDAYVKSLDDALRELGVGDLSVGKRMRKLGEAFYGRVKSYDAAFARLPDSQELDALLARTVVAGGAPEAAERLSAYARASVSALAGQDLQRIFAGDLAWPDFGDLA